MHDVLEGGPRIGAVAASNGAATATHSRPLLVAVPLYRSPELVAPLAAALLGMADELRALDATLLLIDDSPDDAALRAELDAAMPALAAALRVELVRNPENLGFVRSANRALVRARDAGHDVLLLNSDALPRPGAFAEMVAVAALDPMTAVVSPRSDNATICNSPVGEEHRRMGGEHAYAAHRMIQRHLPRTSYVPTAVGFCLLIRNAMLREFGLFDEVYGGGYNEENDFIRRCNQRGYRAVLANRAYVHHLGGASFGQTVEPPSAREERNRAILLERYPEYDAIVARWFDGAEFRTQRLLSGLIPAEDGRLRLVFDCGTLRGSYNGTYEHIRALLAAFAARYAGRYDIAVLCDPDAFDFHGLDRISGLHHIDPDDALARPAAAVMRLGQPFTAEDLAPLCDYAATCGVLMFDTIAMDCQQLDDSGLEALWATMVDSIDAVGFNSAFSRDQFRRRFDVPGRVVEFVSRCSTDPADYAAAHAAAPDAAIPDAAAAGGVLLVGNHYPHKHVRATLAALRAAAPDLPVTVLGLDIPDDAGVTSYAAGDLEQDLVDDLYERARVVLFPSHYEGFGLPILHALARRRPVIARDLPSAREIRAMCGAGDNLHLAGSTDEMIALALDPPCWRDAPPRPGAAPAGWAVAADAVADAVSRALARFDYGVCRRRQDRALALRGSSGIADAARWMRAASGGDGDGPRLPPHGHGFMLAEMIEVAEADAAVPPQGTMGVRIEAALDERGADAIAGDVLELLRDQPSDGAVTLVLHAADAHAARAIAATILLSCGCMVTAIEAVPQGVVAHGRYRHEWTALLPGPEVDADFVRHAYRHALGRNPDPEGGRNYLAELADGLTRDAMLRLFLGSSERRNVIAAHLRRRGIAL